MATDTDQVELLRLAARKLTGVDRRMFVAEVALRLCDGKERLAEERFGWSRETVRKGLAERETGEPIATEHKNCGRRRSEDQQPQLAADIRDIAEPNTQADPELKSERRYLNLSAAALSFSSGWCSSRTGPVWRFNWFSIHPITANTIPWNAAGQRWNASGVVSY